MIPNLVDTCNITDCAQLSSVGYFGKVHADIFCLSIHMCGIRTKQALVRCLFNVYQMGTWYQVNKNISLLQDHITLIHVLDVTALQREFIIHMCFSILMNRKTLSFHSALIYDGELLSIWREGKLCIKSQNQLFVEI